MDSEAGDPDGAGRPAAVTVRVPGLLTRFTGGEGTVSVEAGTVGESLDRLVEAHPDLRPHLFDSAGRLRPHLGLLHNGRTVPPAARDGVHLADGDAVVVLQAVSGGSGMDASPG